MHSLLPTLTSHPKKTIIIIVSHDIEEANKLYREGASYVILPHFVGGSYVAMMIQKYKLDFSGFSRERRKHIKYLMKRIKLGHYHPRVEKNK